MVRAAYPMCTLLQECCPGASTRDESNRSDARSMIPGRAHLPSVWRCPILVGPASIAKLGRLTERLTRANACCVASPALGKAWIAKASKAYCESLLCLAWIAFPQCRMIRRQQPPYQPQLQKPRVKRLPFLKLEVFLCGCCW